MARAVVIKADSDDCSLTLTGEAAAKVWDYILEEVYIEKSINIDIEPKSIAEVVAKDIAMLKEGYLGKV